MINKNYYEILGIDKNASQESIKKAFRQLSMKWHPDQNNNSEESNEKFKEIGEAYATLSDLDKKAHYDNPGIDTNFIDIESMFGLRRNQQQRPTNPPMRGADINKVVELPIWKFLFGAKEVIDIEFNEACSICKGKGFSKMIPCTNCNGKGSVTQVHKSANQMIHMTQPCPICRGSGEIGVEHCTNCKDGGVSVTKKLEVEITPNTINGQVSRLRGVGPIGINGGGNGDIYLKFIMEYPNLEKMSDEAKENLKEAIANAYN